jgi:uncharacterized protein RhaS with RHS repeats
VQYANRACNGLTTSRSYDVLGQPTTLAVTNGATDVQRMTYQYDAIGNITQRVDVVQNNLTETFAYDNLNRRRIKGTHTFFLMLNCVYAPACPHRIFRR